ncbi:hypothetical protein KGF86_13270 [Ornithinibacillus massiliensis]|uniref:Carboxylic ester hydrolase n=2 Tax=Ornithinibacillus massiliensis TaxID=1944633 RepID=A0ABS5MFR7_9BACI|nr:hypothetical protein [Ornithinibacillus massiliensis]
MNVLEILYSISVVLTVILWGKKKNLLLLLVMAQWILLLTQVWVNGWRLPMVLLYLITLFLTFRLTFNVSRTKKQTVAKRTLITVFLLFALALPGYLFPWFTVKEPTGPYQVGTKTFEVVDNSRVDQWAEGDEPRRIMVQLWYPTEDVKHSPKAKYHEHPSLFMEEFAELNGIPGFLLQSFVKQKVPAYNHATLLNQENPYPIIFFSHGFGSNRSQNHFQVLELASQGYIVVGIDHTYFSPGTVFSNGDRPGLADIEFTGDDDLLNDYLYEWSKDAQSVLNWVENVNDGEIHDEVWLEQAKGQIDLSKVGYLGHSFGGATASHTLAVDNRFHAGINMDGFPYGDAHELGVKQPFLTLIGDDSLTADYIDDEDYLAEFYRRIESISGSDNVIPFKDALHLDFSDFPLLSPVTKWIGMTGNLSTKELHNTINNITLEFFNTHLNVSN